MNESLTKPQTELTAHEVTASATSLLDRALLHTRETYTVEETATLLGISRGSAYAAVNRGEIPSIRINRRLLVPRERLRQFLNEAPAAIHG